MRTVQVPWLAIRQVKHGNLSIVKGDVFFVAGDGWDGRGIGGISDNGAIQSDKEIAKGIIGRELKHEVCLHGAMRTMDTSNVPPRATSLA